MSRTKLPLMERGKTATEARYAPALWLLLTTLLLSLALSSSTAHPRAAPLRPQETSRASRVGSSQQMAYTPIGEIVDPASPMGVRAVEEKDGIAYLLTREGDLHAYDISDLRDQTAFVTYDAPLHSQEIANDGGLLRYGDYLYAFGHRGLEVLDIRDPEAPSVVDTISSAPSIYNMVRQGDHLFAAGGNHLIIYSIADPSDPQVVSSLDAGDGKHVWSAASHGQTIFVGEWTTDAGRDIYTHTLRVVDFSDPAHLSTRRTLDQDGSAYHLRIVGDHLISCSTYAIELWDLSTPTWPVLRDSSSAKGRVCAVDGDNVVVNGKVFRPSENKLELIDTFEAGFSQCDGYPYGSLVTEDFVFLAQSPRILILKRETVGSIYLPMVLNQVLSSPYEPNNRPSEAYGPLQPGVTYRAYPDDREDWYTFTLPGTRDLQVEVSNFAGGGGRLMVYAADDLGTTVPEGDDSSGGPTMRVTPSELPPGTYYIRVYTGASTDTSTLYNLRYDLGG